MFPLDPLANNGQSYIKKKPVIANSSCLIHVSFFETPETNAKEPPSEGIGLQAGSKQYA